MTIFVRAVEKNSFVGAARSLLIDPAAVSRAVNALETDLGVRLFTRSTRAMKLTADGARFHRDCTQILQKFTEATQRFRVDRTVPHGRLTVGMTSGLTRRMMLQALSVFQQQYPQIEILLLSVDDLAEIGDKGVDVLVRPRGLRQRGGQHSEAQGLVVRKLAGSFLWHAHRLSTSIAPALPVHRPTFFATHASLLYPWNATSWMNGSLSNRRCGRR